jgi:hypothetical protein
VSLGTPDRTAQTWIVPRIYRCEPAQEGSCCIGPFYAETENGGREGRGLRRCGAANALCAYDGGGCDDRETPPSPAWESSSFVSTH